MDLLALIVVMLAIFWLAGCAAHRPVINKPVSPTLVVAQRLLVMENRGVGDWDVDGDDHAADLARLIRWAEDHHMVVATAPLSRFNLLGHSSVSRDLNWVVLVDRDISVNNRLYTLLHELGHVFGPTVRTVQESETVAELTAVQVCENLGLNVWPQTAAYLWNHVSPETQIYTAQRFGPAIDAVVLSLSMTPHVSKHNPAVSP